MKTVLAALALALLLTGCLIVPYNPSASTEHTVTAIPNPERLRLSVGPRRFLEKAAEKIIEIDQRFQLVDGQTFLDTASPSTELTLARLLDPGTKLLIESTDADFLVLIGEPESVVVDGWGGIGPTPVGAMGLSRSKQSTSYWAAVIDTRRMELVEQLTSESVGTDSAVGFGVLVAVISNTDGSARKESIRQIADTMATSRPSGAVRFVLLAVESIPGS